MACRLVGRGRAGGRRISSILNLDEVVSTKCWLNHTKTLALNTTKLAKNNMKEATYEAKLYSKRTGQMNDLKEKNIEIGVSFDGSWGSRGWSARQGIVDACFEETGKVVDVIFKSSTCRLCSTKKSKKNERITLVEYLEWYTKHEKDCLMNHEGSAV